MVFSFLLELTTDLGSFRNAAKSGKWTGMADYMYQEYKHVELSELTIGLVGCGDIGMRVAQIAKSFGMKVIATTSSRTQGSEDGIEFLPLDRTLALSDVVSLHCPLTDKTRVMVDEAFISKLKQGAILINTARGGIVNEKVLYEALKSGRLSAAGLDVMATEPPGAENPLFSLDNCIITPHISWATKAARLRLQKFTDNNIAAFLSSGEIKSRIV
jgi:glycerate dehydrogenase